MVELDDSLLTALIAFGHLRERFMNISVSPEKGTESQRTQLQEIFEAYQRNIKPVLDYASLGAESGVGFTIQTMMGHFEFNFRDYTQKSDS